MKYSIRKNWISSLDLLTRRPVILVPFAFLAFFETLALELIYFYPRKPLMYLANPIIKKFYGPAYLHYPANLILTPKLFYFAQVAIYIGIGVLISAVTVNIVRNIQGKLPLKTSALLKNAATRYGAFFMYGAFVAALLVLAKRVDTFIFFKALGVVSRLVPDTLKKFLSIGLPLSLFVVNAAVTAFLVLVVPIIVIKKVSLLKAFIESVVTGFRNFRAIFTMIFIPYLLYIPIVMMKGFPIAFIKRTFPEIIIVITFLGIILALFIECFIMVCAAQFYLDTAKGTGKK